MLWKKIYEFVSAVLTQIKGRTNFLNTRDEIGTTQELRDMLEYIECSSTLMLKSEAVRAELPEDFEKVVKENRGK